MRARAFWKAVTADRADLLDRCLSFLQERGIRFCLIGGQAVNAYATPVVSLDLDLIVAADQLPGLREGLTRTFAVEEFAHSLSIGDATSGSRCRPIPATRTSSIAPSSATCWG
jgi:hypothetical protein